MLRALGCQAPPLPRLSDTSGTHLVLGPGLGERVAMGVPLALPRPSAVCLFVCPVQYLPAGLLCPRRLRGAKSASAGPQPRAPFSSWLCLSCALQDPLVWAAPHTVRWGGWRGGGEAHFLAWLPPPTSGFLELFVWGCPRVEFLYTSCFGVCCIYVLIVGGVLGGALGERHAVASQGAEPSGTRGGWGGGSTTPPCPGPPPRRQLVPHSGAVASGSRWDQAQCAWELLPFPLGPSATSQVPGGQRAGGVLAQQFWAVVGGLAWGVWVLGVGRVAWGSHCQPPGTL